jgi:hypothetical protein
MDSMTIRHLLPVVILAMLGLATTTMAQGPMPYGVTIL